MYIGMLDGFDSSNMESGNIILSGKMSLEFDQGCLELVEIWPAKGNFPSAADPWITVKQIMDETSVLYNESSLFNK
jgi:hypothetical protein